LIKNFFLTVFLIIKVIFITFLRNLVLSLQNLSVVVLILIILSLKIILKNSEWTYFFLSHLRRRYFFTLKYNEAFVYCSVLNLIVGARVSGAEPYAAAAAALLMSMDVASVGPRDEHPVRKADRAAAGTDFLATHAAGCAF
jgi:hypothetical protein